MEVAGVVVRPVMNFYGAGVDTQVSKSAPCPSGLSFDHAGKRFSGKRLVGIQNSRVIMARKPTSFAALSSSGFADAGHLEYYVSARKKKEKEMEMEKEKEKEKSCEVKKVKRKLKLIKRLSKDMSMVSDMAVESENSLVGEVKGKMMSEAMELLQAQLQLMRLEQKELKRKKKAELKATMVKASKSHSSSSSSSESSDSECGEVIDMSRLRCCGSKQSKDNEPAEAVEEATFAIHSSPTEEVNLEEVAGIGEPILQIIGAECCTGTPNSFGDGRSSSVAVRAMALSEQRVEVCMGGKCKKMGAMALLEEFEKKVGEEGAVVGCKCMGKCKTGPNVRLKNHSDGIQDDRGEGSFKFQTNPLFIGVALEDVGEVVATFLGKQSGDKCMVAPA